MSREFSVFQFLPPQELGVFLVLFFCPVVRESTTNYSYHLDMKTTIFWITELIKTPVKYCCSPVSEFRTVNCWKQIQRYCFSAVCQTGLCCRCRFVLKRNHSQHPYYYHNLASLATSARQCNHRYTDKLRAYRSKQNGAGDISDSFSCNNQIKVNRRLKIELHKIFLYILHGSSLVPRREMCTLLKTEWQKRNINSTAYLEKIWKEQIYNVEVLIKLRTQDFINIFFLPLGSKRSQTCYEGLKGLHSFG
jgi:hypothetical protein